MRTDRNTTSEGEAAETVIEARQGWQFINFRDLWQFRELAYFLCWRDIKIRYKQTALGALWAILQPFLNMVVFTVFFGRLAGLEDRTGGIPYPVFVYAGLLPWTLFAQSIGRSSESVVASANLVTKVYFPRLLIPLAAVGACVVDFVVAASILVGMMFWYGVVPTGSFALVPVFVVLTVMTSLGIGALLSALTVAYRDFRYVVPFLVQLWLFVTPVIYPATVVPEGWRWLLSLNPMSGIITGYRSSILGMPFDWRGIAISVSVATLFLVYGLAYFRRVERQFADII